MAQDYVGHWDGSVGIYRGSVRYDVGHGITLAPNVADSSHLSTPDNYLAFAAPNDRAYTLTLYTTDYPDIPATERFVQEHHYSVPTLPASHEHPTRMFATFDFPDVPTRTHPYIRVMINLTGDRWLLYPGDSFPSYCDIHLSVGANLGLRAAAQEEPTSGDQETAED